MKYLSFISVFLVVSWIPSFNIALAEDQEKVIIISEEVGEVIDTEERAKFNLWPEIKGFISTVFLQLPDGSYVAEVTYEKDGEKEKIRTPQSETSIASVKHYIENYEEIETPSFASKGGNKKKKIVPIKNGEPRSGAENYAGKIKGGCLSGGIITIGAILITAIVRPDRAGEVGNLWPGLVGLAVYPFGCAIGVYLAGTSGNETGSFGATLAGSYTGGLIGCLAFGIGYLVGAPIGATIGYNKSRKKISSPETGFINYKDDRLSLTIPSIYYTQENTFEGKTITQNVTLVKISF